MITEKNKIRYSVEVASEPLGARSGAHPKEYNKCPFFMRIKDGTTKKSENVSSGGLCKSAPQASGGIGRKTTDRLTAMSKDGDSCRPGARHGCQGSYDAQE